MILAPGVALALLLRGTRHSPRPSVFKVSLPRWGCGPRRFATELQIAFQPPSLQLSLLDGPAHRAAFFMAVTTVPETALGGERIDVPKGSCQAGLRGPFGVLAQNAVLREREGNTLVLALQPAHMGMAVEPMLSQMEERISGALGERIKLRFVDIDKSAASATPAARATQARDAAQAAAEQSIEDDPFVQSMKRDFGARVVPQSVKPFGS